MKFDFFQVDSFTNKLFRGNPACVVRLNKWLPDDILLNIAKENAVAETAFFVERVKVSILDGLLQILKSIYVVMLH